MTRGKSSRRTLVWSASAAILAAAAASVAVWAWLQSDGHRASAAFDDLPGVESVELEAGDGPAEEQDLRVIVATASSEAEIEQVIEAAQDWVHEERADRAWVSQGTAELRLGSGSPQDPRESARSLIALNDLTEGSALISERDVAFSGAERAPVVSLRDWVEVIEAQAIQVERVRVLDDTDFATLSIDVQQPGVRETIDILGDVSPDITYLETYGSSMEIRTALPFAELGSFASTVQSAAASLTGDAPSARIETPDKQVLSIVGDSDPVRSIELAQQIADAGWRVQRISTNLAALEITAESGEADPSQMSDLADTLREAGMPQDMTVSVDGGAWFVGSVSDLARLAPTITEAAGEGYLIRWAREDRRPGADARVWVELPAGAELSDDAALAGAIDVARSVPWPGSGVITLQTTPEESSTDDSVAVQITSTAEGPAEAVEVDPERLPGEDYVRAAWDRTTR